MNILRDMDAHVNLESEYGVGSTFVITIPKASPEEGGAEELTSEDNAFENQNNILKILLVEDDSDIADIMEQALLERNYQVVKAENGLVAINKLKEFKPDLILTDIQMPELNRFEMLDRIEKESLYNGPVIISTGCGLAEIHNRYYSKLVKDVLRKPYTDNELYKSIDKALN